MYVYVTNNFTAKRAWNQAWLISHPQYLIRDCSDSIQLPTTDGLASDVIANSKDKGVSSWCHITSQLSSSGRWTHKRNKSTANKQTNDSLCALTLLATTRVVLDTLAVFEINPYWSWSFIYTAEALILYSLVIRFRLFCKYMQQTFYTKVHI